MLRLMKYSRGFALPTVLIVSVILLMLLTTGISATIAVNNGLRDQYYTRLAGLASDAGTAFANACFTSGGNQVTWTDASPLRPNTDCNGAIVGSLPEYVLDQEGIRTYFIVGADMQPKGYTEGVRETSDLAWRVWTTGSVNAVQVPTVTLPAGTIITGTWATAPDGFFFTNGNCVSKTTYAALYTAIGGASFNSGNGYTAGTTACASTSDFRLPNTMGRNVIGKSTSDATFTTLGATAGEKSHLMTIAEMPSHSHAVTDPGHRHIEGFAGVNTTASYGVASSAPSGNINGQNGTNTLYHPYTSTSTTGISIQSNGGGDDFNVLDPYLVLNYAIKY